MQSREEMHRDSGGLAGRHVLIAALALLCLVKGSGAKASEWPAWGCDRNRPGIATECLVSGSDSPKEIRAGVFSALTDPYLLDGLVEGELLAGFEGPSCFLWIDWRHLAAPFYRQDNVTAAFGFEIPAWGVGLGAVPSADRRVVEGFATDMYRSLSLAASYRHGRTARVCLVRSVYESSERFPGYTAASISLHAWSCTASFERVVEGWRRGDSRFLVEARLDRRLSILSGYRWSTGELSSGLALRLSCMLVDFLWSENPALGSTLYAGVGRWWER